jgi:hypothetical protein
MSAEAAQNLAIACAVLGLVCFMWPTMNKLLRGGPGGPATPAQALRSPLWWAGLVLTILALIFLGFAPDAG